MTDQVNFAPQRAWDRTGRPVPGALARFFVAGTSTPATVYADAAMETPLSQPVAADGRGVFAPIYAAGPLDALVTDQLGAALPGYPAPAALIPSGESAASAISFAPTDAVAATNVQAAIEAVATGASSALAAAGWGLTGDAPLLDNLNATNRKSGAYRVTGAASGVSPPGWGADGGIVLVLRQTADRLVQMAFREIDGEMHHRVHGGTSWTAWESTRRGPQMLHVTDQQAAGTPAGTATEGAWFTRTLNTTALNEITGGAVASDVITLPAGRYRFDIDVPAYRVDAHRARLWNVTAGAVALMGTSAFADESHFVTNESRVFGDLTLAVETGLRVEQRVATTKTTTGRGRATDFGTDAPEIYTVARVWRLGGV